MEFPKELKPTILYGVGTDLKIPRMNFVQAMTYLRDDLGQSGKTGQLTIVWDANAKIGKQKIWINGFADAAGHEGKSASNLILQPRVLIDLGQHFGKAGFLFIGSEFDGRINKFGIKDAHQIGAQAIAVFVFGR
jgi:hypothetical protein